jgi:hypothetical protein
MAFRVHKGKRYSNQSIESTYKNITSRNCSYEITGSLVDGVYAKKMVKGDNLPVPVQAKDVHTWFKNSLRPHKRDFVVVKVDIEGSEYSVVPRLLADPSVWCAVDFWYVEWHYKTRHRSFITEAQNQTRRCMKATQLLDWE